MHTCQERARSVDSTTSGGSLIGVKSSEQSVMILPYEVQNIVIHPTLSFVNFYVTTRVDISFVRAVIIHCLPREEPRSSDISLGYFNVNRRGIIP